MRRLEFHISKVIEIPVVFPSDFQFLLTDQYTFSLSIALVHGEFLIKLTLKLISN